LSYYEFKKEDAEDFARQQGARYRISGDELQFVECPYCHGGKHHDKLTFSINLKTGAFNCQRSSCGAHGNMITLSRDFGFSLGRDTDDYYDRYRWNRFKKFKDGKQALPVKDPAVEYLKGRGISEAVTRQYEVTARTGQDNVLVFPFKDADGELRFIKYRNTTFKKGDKGAKEWCEAGCMPILFGMNHTDPADGPLIMTEGQIDSLSVTEAGIKNAVSVPTGKNGFTWIPFCWDWLQNFTELIIFGDHEHGEITLLDEMSKRFHGTVKHVRPEDYKDCKDANDILRKYGPEQIRACIENAIAAPDPHIKLLADVRHYIPTDEDRITTGIADLNDMIGGFYNGQLILLTGERGKGKSTLASQFVLQAVRQQVTSFLYSGEMADWQLQMWFERQVAGADRIETIQSADSNFRTYHVYKQYEYMVNQFYRPYVYFYDSNMLSKDMGDDEALLETVNKAITQFGCRFIVLDNLMTAVDDDLMTDIYRQQTAFVKECARMAKLYNVIIMLVVHPRKTTGYTFDLDSILGSSNITNLADLVLRYDEPTKDDETNAPRVLQVWKNRLSGRVDKVGISLYYEEASKRISQNSKNFYIETIGKEDGGWEPTAEAMEIPF